jgi:hypothetical protein
MVVAATIAPISVPPTSASIAAPTPRAEPNLGNIPVQIVPSTIQNPEVRNNTRGRPAIPLAQPAATPNITIESFTPYSSNGRSGAISNVSAPFFAQLLAQSNAAEQSRLTQAFTAPVPQVYTATVVEQFVNTKYKPSNAGKPVIPPPPPKPDSLSADSELPAVETTENAASILLETPVQSTDLPEDPLVVEAPAAPIPAVDFPANLTA